VLFSDASLNHGVMRERFKSNDGLRRTEIVNSYLV